jgi:hypothetical protein
VLYNASFTLLVQTLPYYISEPEQPSVPSIRYKKPHQVFSDAEESELEEYKLAASKLYYGLTTKDVRNVAYQCAIKTV